MPDLVIQVLLLLVAGIAAGCISGLLGVGGGIVMTPVLHYGVGLDWPDAVALSLFVIAIQVPLGIRGHHKRGAVSLRLAVPLAIGGIAGVGAGIWLEPRLAVPWLKIAFSALMLFAAFRMIAPQPKPEAAPGDEPTAHRPAPVLLVVIGVAAGIVSRLLGVGGGILTVPVLVLLGVPVHVAVGSSLVPVGTNALIASVVNIAIGLEWLLAIPLAIGALAGAPLGVRLAHHLPADKLGRLVAGALAVVALIVAWDALS